MESDNNPMPSLEIFPRLNRVAGFIKRLVIPFPGEAPAYMSEHYGGAEAVLDAALDEPNPDQFGYD